MTPRRRTVRGPTSPPAEPSRTSVWWSLAPGEELAPRPHLVGELRCRTLVVGSGVAGLSLAVALARRGDDVVVVDRSHAAAGATGRNAGFLLRDSECLSLATEEHGAGVARANRALGDATRAFVRTLEGDAFRVDWTGSVRLASDRGEAAHFARSASDDGTLRVEDPADAAESGGAASWLGALADDGDGMLDPLAFVAALVREAERHGVRRFDGTTVQEFRELARGVRVATSAGAADPADPAGRGADVRQRVPQSGASDARQPGGRTAATTPRSRVRTATGSVLAERVIVATNAEFRRLVPGLAAAPRPVRAQALAAWVDPAPAWGRPTYATRGGEYWRRLPDGRVFLGGLRRLDARAENTGSGRPTALHQRALSAYLRRLVGRGARIEVTHRWAGTMGFTPDGAALVGRIPGRPRVHVLAGWNGHGMGWAPGAAAGLAAHLQGAGPPPPKLYAPGRSILGRVPRPS